jgi:hypothetical protein
LPFCHIVFRENPESGLPANVKTLGDAIRECRLLGIRLNDAARLIRRDKYSVTNWYKNHAPPQITGTAGVVAFFAYLSDQAPAVEIHAVADRYVRDCNRTTNVKLIRTDRRLSSRLLKPRLL